MGGGGRRGGYGARECPPKKRGVISFDCQNLTVFSKTVKTGGGGKSAPDNQDSFELIIFSSGGLLGGLITYPNFLAKFLSFCCLCRAHGFSVKIMRLIIRFVVLHAIRGKIK